MSSKRLYRNEKPIRLKTYNYPEEICKLELNTFPLIEDFIILTKLRGKLGHHLYFTSNQFGVITSFPWWDHIERDLKEMEVSRIPIGKMDNPFNDLEQSWQILIWEKRDYVYIMQGKDPCCIEFPIWFRVKRDKYFEEWERVLRNYR